MAFGRFFELYPRHINGASDFWEKKATEASSSKGSTSFFLVYCTTSGFFSSAYISTRVSDSKEVEEATQVLTRSVIILDTLSLHVVFFRNMATFVGSISCGSRRSKMRFVRAFFGFLGASSSSVHSQAVSRRPPYDSLGVDMLATIFLLVKLKNKNKYSVNNKMQWRSTRLSLNGSWTFSFKSNA